MSIFAVFLASPGQLERLRSDVVWALFYAANWHFILTDASYQHLFVAPSPVHHFWSLAIEEQFYFAFPLVAVLGLWAGKGSRLVLGTLLAALALASVFVSVWLMENGASIDRVYYGSDSRASELLLGGLLAVLLQGRQELSALGQRVAVILGVVSMGGMLYLWSTVDLIERWLYYGGFAAYTGLSIAVIIAAVQPAGIVRAFLALSPMRWIGRVSYGAYLFHWPLFLWLSPERTGLGPAPLFALRMISTFGLAHLSYQFLESPIRTGRFLTGWRPLVVTPSVFVVVLASIALATAGPTRPEGEYDPTPDVLALDSLLDSHKLNPPDLDEEPGLGKNLPRVAVFGDSTALSLGVGVGVWLQKENEGRPRQGIADFGCGLAVKGVYRTTGNEMPRPNRCLDRKVAWAELIEQGRPDIAIVIIGPWDVCDRRLPGDDEWRAPGDPVLDAYLQEEMLEAVDILSSDGALVLWMMHPAIEARVDGKAPDTPFPESDPARMQSFNELIKNLEVLRPGKVRAVDLPGHMRNHPGGEIDPAYRPDGTHLTPESGIKLTYEWLGEEILRVYREESQRAGEKTEERISAASVGRT